MNKRLWITYAWEDNKKQDVDFVAQEIEKLGVRIRLDKWDIRAGLRLWEQIGELISNPSETDGWLLIASTNSLSSQACREEMGYAVERALATREQGFPVLALFKGNVPTQNIPPAIKSRLYLRMADQDWKERLLAALERRDPCIQKREILPYEFIEHAHTVFEIRPRIDSWHPVFVAFPADEFDALKPAVTFGPPMGPPSVSMVHPLKSFLKDGWQVRSFRNVVGPGESMYVACKDSPTKLAFGILDGKPQFCHSPTTGKIAEKANIGLGEMARFLPLMRNFWRSEALSDSAILDFLHSMGECPSDTGEPLRQQDWVYLLKFSDDEALYLREAIEHGFRPLTTKRVHEVLNRYLKNSPQTQEDHRLAVSLISWMRMLRERNGKLILKTLQDFEAAMATDAASQESSYQ